MTPPVDRDLADVIADVSALKRGEVATAAEMHHIREDIREVGDGCAAFRDEVRNRWERDENARITRAREHKAAEDLKKKEEQSTADKHKASSKLVAIAVIGACATVIASIISAAAVIIGGAP